MAQACQSHSNEWRVIALASAHTGQYLPRRAIVARAKFYMMS